MKIVIDTEARSLKQENGNGFREVPLYSKEAFEILSQQWINVGWDQKYSYTFSWMGLPIIQLPEDIVRIQEVIYRVRPDVIVETGVAHGGSLVMYASLCKAMDRGRVIGVDIEIRQQNRRAIETHELGSLISMIEGDSVCPKTVRQVESLVGPDETVLVILDSNHTKAHVLAELKAYHKLITPGSYIIATDGIMQELYNVPRGAACWRFDHPAAAAAEFVEEHPEFKLEQPPWPFNESGLTDNITHWPGAWLRRMETPSI